MTKDEFEALQLQRQQSGKSLKQFLSEKGVCYSSYNYWRKKHRAESVPGGLAPITFSKPADGSGAARRSFTGNLPSEATLLFPNGLRAHFGEGTESVPWEVLQQSLASHVLP